MIEFVVSGGPLVTEETYAIDQSLIKIGRAVGNDLVLKDASVSRVHACVRLRGNCYVISDQKSANGTFLNGRRLPSVEEIPLEAGQVVSVGVFRLQLVAKQIVPVLTVTGYRDDSAQRQPAESSTQNTTHPELAPTENLKLLALKQEVHKRLLTLIDLRRLDVRQIKEAELRDRCKSLVEKILNEKGYYLPPEVDKPEFVKDILDEALGLGPLEDLLADPTISEVMVNSRREVYFEKTGQLMLSSKSFSSDASVLGIIQRIVGPIGRRIDESSPMVDARLPDGSRVNAVIPPLALNGPCITIRKFSKTPITVHDLLRFKTLNDSMLKFIQTCVIHKKNIVVSGGTGSGKTTILNIFSSFIPKGERLVTIEDAAELQLDKGNIVRLEARPANIEGKGEISIQALVKNALRMRPDRIIVGECRGGETLDMLQAMNTGHDGSMTTGHANTPHDMVTRLETMAIMAGKDLPSRAIREQIAAAVHIIIQQTRFACGTRKITEISEVVGIEDGQVVLQKIFYFRQDGLDKNGKVTGQFISTGWIPDFIIKLQKRGLVVDLSIFQNF